MFRNQQERTALRSPSAQSSRKYQPAIDGLRAISIIGVVAFHAGVPGFPGGYVGVDVFFVISGYLIINQIRAELEAERFSVVSFYARRALRILPPYLVMLLAVTLAAPFFLVTPSVYVDFLYSALLSPFFSNIFFFQHQGYFDLTAFQKPLLHTWTLSVEEQFYFVAPVALLALFVIGGRRFGRFALLLAVLLALLSLAGAVFETTTTGRNPAFYLAQWRAWEFIAGGLVSHHLEVSAARLPRSAIELVSVSALVMIALAIGAFHAGLPYPSYWAVLPVGGAALLIFGVAAEPGNLVARLLAHPAMVFIGQVSYAWYLWHWPLLSFVRILRLGEASLAADLVAGGLVAFALACATYYFVELPIRRWRNAGALIDPGRTLAGALAACAMILIMCAAVDLSAALETRSVMSDRYGIRGKGVVDNGCRTMTSTGPPSRCLEGKFGLLIGDSQAGAYVGSFTRFFADRNVQLVTIWGAGCDPFIFATTTRPVDGYAWCPALREPFRRSLAAAEPPAFVIVASIWPNRAAANELFTELIGQFDPRRTKILLVGPLPYFPQGGLDCVVLADRYADRKNCERRRLQAAGADTSIVEMLKENASRYPNVHAVDPADLFCDHEICRTFKGNTVLYDDPSHVTPAGADDILDGFSGDFRWLAGTSE